MLKLSSIQICASARRLRPYRRPPSSARVSLRRGKAPRRRACRSAGTTPAPRRRAIASATTPRRAGRRPAERRQALDQPDQPAGQRHDERRHEDEAGRQEIREVTSDIAGQEAELPTKERQQQAGPQEGQRQEPLAAPERQNSPPSSSAAVMTKAGLVSRRSASCACRRPSRGRARGRRHTAATIPDTRRASLSACRRSRTSRPGAALRRGWRRGCRPEQVPAADDGGQRRQVGPGRAQPSPSAAGAADRPVQPPAVAQPPRDGSGRPARTPARSTTSSGPDPAAAPPAAPRARRS